MTYIVYDGERTANRLGSYDKLDDAIVRAHASRGCVYDSNKGAIVHDARVRSIYERLIGLGHSDTYAKEMQAIVEEAVSDFAVKNLGYQRMPAGDRQTFTVPEGFEAIRDAEGRATGAVRPILGDSEEVKALKAERDAWRAAALEGLDKNRTGGWTTTEVSQHRRNQAARAEEVRYADELERELDAWKTAAVEGLTRDRSWTPAQVKEYRKTQDERISNARELLS